MNNEDLSKNILLDDEMMSTHPTHKQPTKKMSAYEVARRIRLTWYIIKGAIIFTFCVGVIYFGYHFITKVNDAVKEAAIAETKDVAKEKYEDAKDKAKNLNFIEAVAAASKTLNAKYDKVMDDRLTVQGYDVDAPNFCAFNPTKEQLKECLQYTDTELSMEEYDWIQTAWKDKCEEVHESTIKLLTREGRLTHNDKRALIKECDKIKAQQTDKKLEEMKQRMITGGSDV